MFFLFFFWAKKISPCYLHNCRRKFNVGKKSKCLDFGQIFTAIRQSHFIRSASTLCSSPVAIIFSTNPRYLYLPATLHSIWPQWKIIILLLINSPVHCSCQIKINLLLQSYSSFLIFLKLTRTLLRSVLRPPSISIALSLALSIFLPIMVFLQQSRLLFLKTGLHFNCLASVPFISLHYLLGSHKH